jgi:hypothetical protein
VESGRGRLRFICSASHTRADVDRTLEALIDAEREAEGKLLALKEQVSGASGWEAAPAHPGRSGVEEWAKAFCAYLKGALAQVPGPLPKLAVSIGLPDNGERITILIHERDITLSAQETTHTPFCALLLTDNQAFAALCSSDVQGLLDNIIKGTCALSGQTEPFIWLIGRMADWQRSGAV